MAVCGERCRDFSVVVQEFDFLVMEMADIGMDESVVFSLFGVADHGFEAGDISQRDRVVTGEIVSSGEPVAAHPVGRLDHDPFRDNAVALNGPEIDDSVAVVVAVPHVRARHRRPTQRRLIHLDTAADHTVTDGNRLRPDTDGRVADPRA